MRGEGRKESKIERGIKMESERRGGRKKREGVREKREGERMESEKRRKRRGREKRVG